MAFTNTLIVAVLLAFHSAPQDGPTAGPILSKMLAHYTGARTMQGTIVTTQSARNVKIVTQTEVAIEKPAKLRISQTRNGSEGGKWLVVSDGRTFSYDRPKGVFGKDRFTDPVDGDLGDLYTAVSQSIGEKSIPLDILIGRSGDLKTFVGMLSPMTLKSGALLANERVELATGKFRKVPGGPLVGLITLAITPTGDLRRLTQVEKFAVPGSTTEFIEVTTEFTVNVRVDGEIQGDPFQVR